MSMADCPGQPQQQYREFVRRDLLPGADRLGALLFFCVCAAFVLVDWWLFRDRFWEFLLSRALIGLVAVWIGFWGYQSRPLASAFVGAFAGGLMLLHVIHRTGGASSDYYVGLVLLLMGIGVVLPFSSRQAGIVIGGLFGVHVVLSVLEAGGLDQRAGLQLCYLLAAGFVGIMSCGLLDRMRYMDFCQRNELERARDALAELDRTKSRFTTNVHHELRTPLTLTLAPVEAMLSGQFGEVSELQRGYLKTIESNALRLLKLINNLLDLAKIEGQQLTVTRRPMRVQDLVGEIVSGALPLAERKGVELVEEGLADLPPLNADPEALEKVVVNLLGNALKFSERGGRIRISGRARDDGGVHLVVADTGAGIPADQLERIFDRFAQVDASSTRKHEGTGIGLALAKEMVELHGGRIWAESEGVGRGAEMHVVLPAGESDLEGAGAVADEGGAEAGVASEALASRIAGMGAELGLDEEAAASHGDLRLAELEHSVERSEGVAARAVCPPLPEHAAGAPEVLVVEDNADMRRFLAFLVGQEFRVRVARNGREALEEVRRQRPDLVLTDIMMPEMSGTELCAAIKEDTELASIPVVLVTSKAERQMKIEGLELGADDYVTKPFHPRELLARVRSLVKLHRTQAELAERNALLASTNEQLERTMEELKEATAQLVHTERLAAVGELAAGVAHEVNNPVNFAMNAAKGLQAAVDEVRAVVEELITIDPTDPEAPRREMEALTKLREGGDHDPSSGTLAELTDIVTEGLERTAALVGDLRDFAAPGERERSRVDVTRGLRTTLRLMGHTFTRAGITVHADLPEGLPRVVGDSRALNQVFLNLLKNAAEVLSERGGSVWVQARSEGDFVAVEIRDDGPGVPAAVRERLFEPFFTTKAAGRGTGLGLSISRRISEEHGGSLELASEPGEGARLVVRLPVEVRPEGKAPHAS